MGILSTSTAASSSPDLPVAIVIGAGVAGLSCASKLVKAGYAVLILEARGRIGGRTHTSTDDKICGPMDLGASFIHGLAGNPLRAIAKRDKLSLYHVGTPQQQTTLIYGPDGPPIADELAGRLGLNSLRMMFDTSQTHAQDRDQAYPAVKDSLADYIREDGQRTLFDGLETETEKQYAMAVTESLNDWVGAEYKDTSLRYWHSNVTYEGPDSTIINGYQGIYKTLAEEMRKDVKSSIRLNEEVVGIRLSEDGDSVEVETKSAKSSLHDGANPQNFWYTAPFCVCTLPLGVFQKRSPSFVPSLPKRRLDAIARLGMGVLNKAIFTYLKCFWPINQDFFTLLPSSASVAFMPMLAHRAIFVQNYLPISGKNTLVVYFGASAASELELKSDQEVKEGIHAILKHHFDGQSKDFPIQPESVTVTRWEKDIYSYGSYSYIRPARESEKDVPTPYDFSELSRPQWGNKLFFAGEATDPDHHASVHGALLTGRREAQRILDALEAKEFES